MQIRLYIDEDAMARGLVNGLRARGVDVTTVYDEGLSGQSDTDQLIHATRTERAIYTFNVGHFCKLQKIIWRRVKNILESLWFIVSVTLWVNR